MTIIDKQLLDTTSARAKTSARLRMNHNFHADMDAPLHRLLNAMEPDTYLRPHRHCRPDRHEIFLLLRGRVAIFLFDVAGNVTETVVLDPQNGTYGGEIPAGVWHGLLVLEPDSVMYEVKQGPFAPLTSDNLAPWSPEAGDTDAVRAYMDGLYSHLKPTLS
ncbi:MAG: WbuC family cupin fold metalloprotein [Tannerella sp.]|jgi:cupin fold WbuC family metalloprotein|nr:WbuC family cupin fold metalloprotein [Tannerella sp.]